MVSRGLLQALAAQTPVRWAAWAPWLDRAIAGDASAQGQVPAEVTEAARRAGVLTFTASLAVAELFVNRHLNDVLARLGTPLLPRDDVTLVELWNPKEGHTASVWCVTVKRLGFAPVRFALNVARDRAASAELVASAATLAGIANHTPALVAEPLHLALADKVGLGDVAVLAQRWIDGALELGVFRTRGAVVGRIHALERFLTAASSPATITGIRGRCLTDDEHRLVIAAAARAVLAGAERLPADRLSMPRIDVGEGDLVLAGDEVRLVAAAAERDVVAGTDVVAHLAGTWRAAGLDDEHGRSLVQEALVGAVTAGMPPL